MTKKLIIKGTVSNLNTNKALCMRQFNTVLSEYMYLLKSVVVLFPLVLIGCSLKPIPPLPSDIDSSAWESLPLNDKAFLDDPDNDGIPTYREQLLKTDPNSADTDNDGFTDGFEDIYGEFGFNPGEKNTDTDKDGLTDSLELSLGSSMVDVDTDNDSWGDFDEYLNRYYRYDLISPSFDKDFDGLTDSLEEKLGSSSSKVDSNDDGITDFQAYHAGFAPLDRFSEEGLGESIGTTYSASMLEAINDIRSGQSVSNEITNELPYSEVTSPPILSKVVKASAALMQRSASNPTNSPALYDDYYDLERQLYNIASEHSDIVRLFYWSEPTLDCCTSGNVNKRARRIYALKISDNPGINEAEPEIAFFGLHHARELITATITMDLIKNLTKKYKQKELNEVEAVNNNEIWVIPVVNPNGYDKVIQGKITWRKNTRKVSETQTEYGVDINRNYGHAHVSMLTQSERMNLSSKARLRNGVNNDGTLDEDHETYPSVSSFTEVESQVVRGLALSSFRTKNPKQVDGLDCSLSWHSFWGLVGHPLGYVPMDPRSDLSLTDREVLGMYTEKVSQAIGSGYTNDKDSFKIDHYPVYGDSQDWLYKDKQTIALYIEAYSEQEGRVGYKYYPMTLSKRNDVSNNNYRGALELIRSCRVN